MIFIESLCIIIIGFIVGFISIYWQPKREMIIYPNNLNKIYLDDNNIRYKYRKIYLDNDNK
jgi:hypothetical protein